MTQEMEVAFTDTVGKAVLLRVSWELYEDQFTGGKLYVKETIRFAQGALLHGPIHWIMYDEVVAERKRWWEEAQAKCRDKYAAMAKEYEPFEGLWDLGMKLAEVGRLDMIREIKAATEPKVECRLPTNDPLRTIGGEDDLPRDCYGRPQLLPLLRLTELVQHNEAPDPADDIDASGRLRRGAV